MKDEKGKKNVDGKIDGWDRIKQTMEGERIGDLLGKRRTTKSCTAEAGLPK